jgi:hypothetical protein
MGITQLPTMRKTKNKRKLASQFLTFKKRLWTTQKLDVYDLVKKHWLMMSQLSEVEIVLGCRDALRYLSIALVLLYLLSNK